MSIRSDEADPDLEWLLGHKPAAKVPVLREIRVKQVDEMVRNLTAAKRFPYTVGLFGGWGVGKTTFLSVLANNLERSPSKEDFKVIYFNAWKYAGFMEIVPSLIYKILQYGNYNRNNPEKLLLEIMSSLGKEYSDRVGRWAEERVGVNPTKMLIETGKIFNVFKDGAKVIPENVIEGYYTQVDRVQDLLAKVFKNEKKVTIVLIDELDRCDPHEAFAVIKQLRVLFSMRKLPIIFIVCANPEPIGLWIKHQFGLSSPSGEFEARRILEKFVDIYIDMSEALELQSFVRWLWKEVSGKDPNNVATLIDIEAGYGHRPSYKDFSRDVTALQAMRSDNPMYSNLRLLRKSLEYISARTFVNSHLLWSAWHLEIAEQMDPTFRSEIATVAKDVGHVTHYANRAVLFKRLIWHNERYVMEHRKDRQNLTEGEPTLFCLYRDEFWEEMKRHAAALASNAGAEEKEKHRVLTKWLASPPRVEFVIQLSLLPWDDIAEKPNPEPSEASSQKIAKNYDKPTIEMFLGDINQKTSRRISEFELLLATY